MRQRGAVHTVAPAARAADGAVYLGRHVHPAGRRHHGAQGDARAQARRRRRRPSGGAARGGEGRGWRRPAGWALVGENEEDDDDDDDNNVTAAAAIKNSRAEPGACAPLGAVE